MNKFIKMTVLAAFLTLTCYSTHAITNTVNLARFPDTQILVPSGTIMSNQWKTIGILFSARRSNGQPLSPVDLGYFFFSPDVYGAVGIYDFVDTNMFAPSFADYFQLSAGMDPSESITLIGLDETGQTVAQTNYSRGPGGAYNVTTTFFLSGHFKQVECRTFGNPGIGLYNIKFQGSSTFVMGKRLG